MLESGDSDSRAIIFRGNVQRLTLSLMFS